MTKSIIVPTASLAKTTAAKRLYNNNYAQYIETQKKTGYFHSCMTNCIKFQGNRNLRTSAKMTSPRSRALVVKGSTWVRAPPTKGPMNSLWRKKGCGTL